MTKRQWIVSSILTLAIILIGAAVFQMLGKKKESTIKPGSKSELIRQVEVTNFTEKDIPLEINLDGRLQAYEKINLMSEVTGKILPSEKTYKTGSFFNKGDLLFNIDSKEQEYNLFAQRSRLLTAITQIMPDLKFDYPDVYPKWQAYLNDFDIEKTTPKLPVISEGAEKYYLSGKEIFNLYYTIKGLEDRLTDFKIHAPFSGQFTSISVFPGSLVNPSMSLGQIMNSYAYEFVAPIAYDKISYVNTGQTVTLTSPDLSESWNGKVSRISKQIDQSTQSINVFIRVSGKGLRDGMFMEGQLMGKTLKSVVEIPREIIVDQNYIFVVAENRLVKKPIEILERSDKKLWVKGINAEDKVVIASVNNLYEGQKVRI